MHAASKSYPGWEMLTCGGEGRTGHRQGAVCKLLHCSEGLGAGRQHDWFLCCVLNQGHRAGKQGLDLEPDMGGWCRVSLLSSKVS